MGIRTAPREFEPHGLPGAAMYRKLIGACVGLAMMGMAGTANATLIGSTVEYDRIFAGGDSSGLGTAVVGAGVEFTEGVTIFSDIDDSSISLFFGRTFSFTLDSGDGIQQFIRYSGLTWTNDLTAVIESIDITFG